MTDDLGIAIILAAASVTGSSVLISVYRRGAQVSRVVALPLDAGRDGCMPIQDKSTDVFDEVARPEDFIDGYPLDEAAFWARMRRRKIVLSSVLAAALATQLTSLASLARLGASSFLKSAPTAFTAYLLLFSTLSLNANDGASHSYYVMTVAVLIGSSSCLFAGVALFPSSEREFSSFPTILRYQGFALYLVSSAVVITTPSGPPLHFPLDKIYSKQTVEAVRSHAANNVNEFAST
ncbi:hypothetical protein B0H10DRAFT_2217975 [Mycena sp. CBHHK59/15]|nr:hypothetical protein B0H10DRAFT_2217975 [Mycena sp. CBHHK59/15]